MTGALFWLTLTLFMTALFWLPYSLNRILRNGLVAAMANPKVNDENPYINGLSAWAQRAYFAHVNAMENLAIFSGLAIIAHLAGAGNAGSIVLACQVYFFARLAHYIIYAAGIPVARTLSFAVAWFACIIIALALLGVV